ncbi:hypothetical protein SS50377_23899 [Spironucleus salmonicida]|uniref:Uncharacterized protein n=1 Tax=Spironucleus salmonicida TaxID=348837 RepID=A0A9P8RYD5_9EUKA|nr:hypothetical protein SS50377_23899 [Spironucleus salmonicida]
MYGTTCGAFHARTIQLLCAPDGTPLTNNFMGAQDLLDSCRRRAGVLVASMLELTSPAQTLTARAWCRNCQRLPAPYTCGGFYSPDPVLCATGSLEVWGPGVPHALFLAACRALGGTPAGAPAAFFSVQGGSYCPLDPQSALDYCTVRTSGVADCGLGRSFQWCPAAICLDGGCAVSTSAPPPFRLRCEAARGALEYGVLAFGTGDTATRPQMFRNITAWYCAPTGVLPGITTAVQVVIGISAGLWLLVAFAIAALLRRARRD